MHFSDRTVGERTRGVLFDSGATLSFINKKFVLHSKLEMQNLRVPYHIESPGGEIIARNFVDKVPILIEGAIFCANLLIVTPRVFAQYFN